MTEKIRRPHYTRQMNSHLRSILTDAAAYAADESMSDDRKDPCVERLIEISKLDSWAQAMEGYFGFKAEQRSDRKQAKQATKEASS